ncbi:hypothetical protein, partial [Sinorhizobium meliloti]|uniref:hypothetical protein n=1 Tax=Rhizobium meliloti TaxID=382 RepID=UPI001AEC7639
MTDFDGKRPSACSCPVSQAALRGVKAFKLVAARVTASSTGKNYENAARFLKNRYLTVLCK